MTQTLDSVGQKPLLLLVEDSNEDFETLQRFLRRLPIAIPLHRCVNGEQALAFLYRTGNYENSHPCYHVGMILLDLNLPGTDGREVLRQIKQDEHLKTIPIVVFTTSNNPKDIEICYRYGVDKYIIKPIDFAQLKLDIQKLVDYWFNVTKLPD
jgi:CheY-like chemotaxis protein